MTKLIGTKPNQVPVNAHLSRTAYIRPEDLPVSNAMKAELEGKVDKVEGKQLSTEDYTTSDKSKLEGIESGAQVNTVTSVAGKTGAVALDKGDVGLGNVDNTSDADKPVSTAQNTAIAARLAKSQNLGDLDDAGIARTNLGLGNVATTNYTVSTSDPSGGVDGDVWYKVS